jgi:hypothetical protein
MEPRFFFFRGRLPASGTWNAHDDERPVESRERNLKEWDFFLLSSGAAISQS